MSPEIQKPTKEMKDEAYRVSFFADEPLTQNTLDDAKLLAAYIQRNRRKLNEENIVLSSGNDYQNVSNLNFVRIEGFYIDFPIIFLILFYGFLFSRETVFSYLTIIVSTIIFFFLLTIAMGLHVYRNRGIYFIQGISHRSRFTKILIIGTYFGLTWGFKSIVMPLGLIVMDLIFHIGNLKEFNKLFTVLILEGEFNDISIKLALLSVTGSLLIYSVSQTYGWWKFLKGSNK